MSGETIQAEKQKRKEMYRNRLKQYAATTEQSRTQQPRQQPVEAGDAKDASQDGGKPPAVRQGNKAANAERDRNVAGWIFKKLVTWCESQ